MTVIVSLTPNGTGDHRNVVWMNSRAKSLGARVRVMMGEGEGNYKDGEDCD